MRLAPDDCTRALLDADDTVARWPENAGQLVHVVGSSLRPDDSPATHEANLRTLVRSAWQAG